MSPAKHVTAHRHPTRTLWPFAVVLVRDDGRESVVTRCIDHEDATQYVARLERNGITARIRRLP